MKRTIYFTVFALILSVLLFQCKKEKGEYTLTGKVTHGRTGAAINGAAVNVQKKVVGNSTYSAAYATAANTQTDGSGNFSMTFERENFAALKLSGSYPQFIAKEQELNVSNFTVGTPYTQNLQLYPEAYIQLNITNTLPSEDEDLLKFTFINAHFDCFCCSNGFKNYTGAVDTTVTCKLYGDQWLKYQANFNFGGPDSVLVDSIWCPAFQTTQLNITY